MLTSRGCPHNCVFCYTPAAFDRKIRYNSVDRVLEEISYVAERGSGRLWFADPNFSFSEKRVVSILEGILRRNLEVEMWIETRADMLSPELIRLMKRAGVYLVAMGLESASPNVFPGLDKRLRPERIREAVRLALGAGLDVSCSPSTPCPTRDRRTPWRRCSSSRTAASRSRATATRSRCRSTSAPASARTMRDTE